MINMKRVAEYRAKATEVQRADYDGTMVCTNPLGGDGTYLTVEDAIDAGHAWAFAVTPMQYPVPSAASIIEAMCDDLWECAHEGLDEDALQTALDAWHSAQDSRGAGYMVDETRVVVLR